MKLSPPGRFRNLHLLVDRQKQVEQNEEDMRLSPAELESARLEMEQNYQHQLWKNKHRIQSFLGVRLTTLSTYGMVLTAFAAYFYLKYGTIDPSTEPSPKVSITQWLKEY